MEGGGGTLGLGGGGGSTTGSVSTVSKEDNLIMSSSEVSSNTNNSYPADESELELGLGLSLGCGGTATGKSKAATWGQYARILTAQDFPSSMVSSSSSSSVTKANNNNTSCGTKRSAESFSPPRSGVSQAVGWPPVRASRMNSLLNQAKSPTSEDSMAEKDKNNSIVLEKIGGGMSRNVGSMSKGLTKNSLFVKVNMDGIPIGRKVDLNVHNCYETLARTLDDMFCRPSTNMNARTSYKEEQGGVIVAAGSLRLLDGSSDFVLTYEDKEGDWMLVGDVPWEMFISSVKRLRIMKTSEANGLGKQVCNLR